MKRCIYLALAVTFFLAPLGCSQLFGAKKKSDTRLAELVQLRNEVEANKSQAGITEIQIRRYDLMIAELTTQIEQETERNTAISGEIQKEYAGWTDIIGRGLGAILGGGSVLGMLFSGKAQ